jgi:hypothetical protein
MIPVKTFICFKEHKFWEISSSHCSIAKHSSVMGYDAVSLGESFLTFQRIRIA